MKRRSVVRVVFFLLLLVAPPVSAQFSASPEVDLTLAISPEHPAPRERVVIKAQSDFLKTRDATLVWYANGRKIQEGTNLTEISVDAGPLGSETRISADIVENGTARASSKMLIRPVEIDLLWESGSYVPPFFRGRALPSAGTTMRLLAIPRFVRTDGSFIDDREIIFTWRKNGYVVASVSGRGKSQVSLPAPALFGTDTITVETQTTDGEFRGQASIRVPSTEPLLVLYENHPLFGVQYNNALSTRSFVPEVETSFVAVPYFAQAESPNDGRLIYEWSVNGTRIQSDSERPSELTVNAENSSGTAVIELALTHATNFFMSSARTWGITFSAALPSAFLGDPRLNQ